MQLGSGAAYYAYCAPMTCCDAPTGWQLAVIYSAAVESAQFQLTRAGGLRVLLETDKGSAEACAHDAIIGRYVVIRDVLGPTSTGPNRPLQYDVTWDTFMAAWGAQNDDALAVARPE